MNHLEVSDFYYDRISTPFGEFLAEADEVGLCRLLPKKFDWDFSPRPNRWTNMTKHQMEEYLSGLRRDFTVPLHPAGTEFQLKVWEATRQIPYGKTTSYGQIGAMIGNPKAARGVGQALNKNPILILTPCHRVVAKDGALTGFGAGLPMKTSLLAFERLHSN